MSDDHAIEHELARVRVQGEAWRSASAATAGRALPLAARLADVVRGDGAVADAAGWFFNLLAKLLEGDAGTLRLLRTNPFHGAPPRYVRARVLSLPLHDA